MVVVQKPGTFKKDYQGKVIIHKNVPQVLTRSYIVEKSKEKAKLRKPGLPIKKVRKHHRKVRRKEQTIQK